MGQRGGHACQAEDAHQSCGKCLASKSWMSTVGWALGHAREHNHAHFIDEETEATLLECGGAGTGTQLCPLGGELLGSTQH